MAETGNTSSPGVIPISSPEDKKLYKSIYLENGLQALLIHDSETDKASAALDVNVGFFCDPPSISGLAHFCEHMLFLGTEKYPDDGEYNTYLGEHAGSNNAYTTQENTNYHFDVSHDELEGALDRFAMFFIAPLFTQDATDREMNAVHSEHCKNLQDDHWRLSQLMRSTSNPECPFHKFGTGNINTLKSDPNVRNQLLLFHKKYYSANIMKLSVLGRESLEDLEKLVRSKFSIVKNLNIEVPQFVGTPYPPEYTQKLFKYSPVKNTRKLIMLWPVPPQRQLWRLKPCHIISHLLGHEGEVS